MVQRMDVGRDIENERLKLFLFILECSYNVEVTMALFTLKGGALIQFKILAKKL